jgi:hypothetical protein
LNLGKDGLSMTVGPRGAHITVDRHGQARTTVGVPGTGVSYTTTATTPPPVPEITRRAAPTPGGRFIHWLIGVAGALGLAWWAGWF